VPRWNFTATKARVRRDHHVRLHNTFLKVKSLPVFYLPIIYYPIDEDERSTGFLMPQIGNSTLMGFLVNQGFFWAINRSMDATIAYERYSLIGDGVSTQYRYVASDASRGQINTFFINDKANGSREYTINGSANQELPGGFQSVARVDFFSSFDFQQSFQENYNRAIQRSKRPSGTISRSFKGYNFRMLFDRNDTSFGDRVAVREVLPRITFGARPTRIGPTPVLFGFDTEAVALSRTNRNDEISYQRFDVLPTISYPFTGLSFLTARTSFTGRYTYYTSSLDSAGAFVEDQNVDRRYYETGLDVRGPTFAWIFNTPENFYAGRYKHVIEPQVVWSYRSRVDDFDLQDKKILHLRSGVVYNAQRCGFLFELNRFAFGGFRDEMTFRFGITLANIGSFGTCSVGSASSTSG
jgi:LPS-assembly protein